MDLLSSIEVVKGSDGLDGKERNVRGLNVVMVIHPLEDEDMAWAQKEIEYNTTWLVYVALALFF